MGRQVTAEQTGRMARGGAAAVTRQKKPLCFQDLHPNTMADFTKR